MFNKIMVVCTGNICRSPIGEGLLRQALAGKNKTVISSGVGALIGHPADPMAIQVASSHGLDISGHRAQQATLPLLSAMDLVLTMDDTHSRWLNQQYPQLRGRVHKFLKWNGNKDVDDPYRLPLEAFEKAYAEIETGAQRWLGYL